MKVLAINGSARPNGNTAYAIGVIAEQLKNEGIETEVVTVGNKLVHQCIDCKRCFKEHDNKCVFEDDIVNELFLKLREADGVILGTPIHFAGVSGNIKTVLDRLFYMNIANGSPMRHKVGVAIGAVRRSGGIQAVDTLNKYFEIAEMVVPSSSYWNVIHGMTPGQAAQDDEGNQIMRVLGKNMAWTMKVIDASKDKVTEPDIENKIATNMIR